MTNKWAEAAEEVASINDATEGGELYALLAIVQELQRIGEGIEKSNQNFERTFGSDGANVYVRIDGNS